MKKLLYITDQGEYIDHSFIGPLFETYLKKYLTIDIVYFTDFKSDFEKQDEHRFVIPTRYKTSLLNELSRNDVDVSSYSYVIVRNDIAILKHAIKQKVNYNFKLGFRLSFPKRRAKLKVNIAHNKATFFNKMVSKIKNVYEMNIINNCDFFLPTSQSMQDEFFPDVTIKSMICPAGIDPNIIHENIQHVGKEKRFFYAGTLDKLRKFETILEAFSKVKDDKWELLISTIDPKYAKEMIKRYPNIKDNVYIYNAQTKEELLDLIAKADIGVSLLPDLPIYNTSTPVKTLDYYSSTVPCLMTNTAHVNKIFTDNIDAWFCNFNQEDITKKIEYILTLSKEEVAQIGVKGQERLLDVRNYEKIAKELAQQLESLYDSKEMN